MIRLSHIARHCTSIVTNKPLSRIPTATRAATQFFSTQSASDLYQPDSLPEHQKQQQQQQQQHSAPRTRRPRNKPTALEVTPEAEKRILDLLSQQTPRPAGVRIGLRTRGCNGMAYVLNYADEPSKFDEKVAIQGANVYIDPRALMHIVGTKMDFVDNDLVSEFVFHNPNAKGTCGCGESFNV